MRKLAWEKNGWDDYLYWQSQDRKTFALDSCYMRTSPLSTETAKTALSRKRINKLIDSVLKTPFEGIGKPEPLKENLSGYWSRRINEADRLVYKVSDNYIVVISCRYHY